jgi:hypothetical protein
MPVLLSSGAASCSACVQTPSNCEHDILETTDRWTTVGQPFGHLLVVDVAILEVVPQDATLRCKLVNSA